MTACLPEFENSVSPLPAVYVTGAPWSTWNLRLRIHFIMANWSLNHY